MKDSKVRAAAGTAREERREGGLGGAINTLRSWPGRIKEFYSETRLEMKRVTWPEAKQVRATTAVVVVTVFFFGFYLLLADEVSAWVINLVIRKFRG